MEKKHMSLGQKSSGNISLVTTWANRVLEPKEDLDSKWEYNGQSYGVSPEDLEDAIADAEFQWEVEEATGALLH
jgi:hypothetical protein